MNHNEMKELISEVKDMLSLLLADMEMQKADPLHIRMIGRIKEKIEEVIKSMDIET